tara:strand:- start:441 stop:602 length:162 start_codon:yes stop_codon:yes gene_type:complete
MILMGVLGVKKITSISHLIGFLSPMLFPSGVFFFFASCDFPHLVFNAAIEVSL